MREAGLEPMALLSLLARLGTSQPVEVTPSLEGLAEGFDFAHFGRAPAHFDLAEVEQLNAKLLHHLDFADIADRLPEGASAADWLLLRGNLSNLREYAHWQSVLDNEVTPPELPEEDRVVVGRAAEIAATLDWSDSPWQALAEALKAETGRKGRALFHPLRLALTGRESGPEMAPLLARIGRDRAVARLRAAAT